MESGSSFIPSSEILCLIPMKNVRDAKKRLRISFPSTKQSFISDIITNLFINTIDTVKKFFNFAVVSPSEDTLEVALEQGASFIYQDLGIDLNDALTTSINYAHLTAKWKYVLILTADLPYLSEDTLRPVLPNFVANSFTIISAPERSNSQGTSGLLIPLSHWASFSLSFGINSFNVFLSQFQTNTFQYNVVRDKIGFDLDTLNDLYELKSNSPGIFRQFADDIIINQLFH